MPVKTNLTNKDLTKIITSYNFGEFKGAEAFTHGSVQTNIFLKTSKGKFVLRYYNNRPEKSTLFELNLLKYLKAHKFPCALPIKNNQGKFIGLYKNRPFVVFEYIEGEHIKNPKQKQQLVQKVAEMQNILKKYKPLNIKYRWNYNAAFCKKLAQKKAKEIGTIDAKKKLTWYKKELKKLKLPKALPMGVCHCDFHFSNILFKNGKFNALLDFDDANYTYRIFDLICLVEPFVSSFDWRTWNRFKKSENIFDLKKLKNTIKEYEKFRPLKNLEKKYLFDVFKLSIFIDCLWYFKRGKAKDFFEKRKIDRLNDLGRDKFYHEIFD